MFATPAMAITTPSAVTGVAASNISLGVTTAAAFGSTLQAGQTPTTSAVMLATDTSSAPSLTVQDSTSTAPNAGFMQAAATGCTGSEAKLGNALKVTSVTGGVTSASVPSTTTTFPVALSATAATIGQASAPIAASAVTVNFSQAIGSSEILLTGCNYSVTATYTLS